jgi:hypothetical protein
VQRSFTNGGVTTIESYLYSFSGSDLSGVLLRRSTDGGSTWTNVRQVTYTYYDGTSDNGLAGDLESATVETWDGSAWQTIENYYYRYWTSLAGGVEIRRPSAGIRRHGRGRPRPHYGHGWPG